jgi:very-short-patch-repair endonuclease
MDLRISFFTLFKRRVYLLAHRTAAEKNAREIFKILGVPVNENEIIGPYIVDFVGIDRNFILEIDGSSHIGRDEYDGKRDNFLTNKGYTVFRISNEDVNIKNIAKILLDTREYTE